MKYILMVFLLLLEILIAKDNQFLNDIYTEFTETVTIKYSKTIKIRTKKAYSDSSNSIRNIVYYWSYLNNIRDTNKIFYLYAPEVLYYGTKIKDASCIKDKIRFYKKYPFFSQSIDNLQIVNLSNNLYKIYFDKYVKFRENGKIKKYPSYLVVGYISGYPLIFVEGDSITDRNLLKKYR